MNKISVILALIITLAGCRPKDQCDVGYALIYSHARQVCKENHNFELIGFGGSFYGGDIKMLAANFHAYSELSLDEARKALIKGAEEFLNQINSDTKSIPYLNHHPFSAKDLDYGIGFIDEKKHDFVGNNYIAHAFILNGKVYYDTLNEQTGHLQDFYEETYEEALQKAQISK